MTATFLKQEGDFRAQYPGVVTRVGDETVGEMWSLYGTETAPGYTVGGLVHLVQVDEASKAVLADNYDSEVDATVPRY